MNKNKMIRVFTAFILLFFVSLANIGGCTNSENGDNNPEPTPSASPPPPTPAPTPSASPPPPTPVPTPAPTAPPQPPAPTPVPTIAPPTGQKNAATAIARICVGLINSESGDETDEQLLEAYKNSVEQIMELDLPSGVSDLPVAIGTIRSALIAVAARGNEEQSELAEELASVCEEDLNAL